MTTLTVYRCERCGKLFTRQKAYWGHYSAHPYDEYVSTIPLSPLEKNILKLLQGGPMTRPEIVRAIEIPRTTVYDVLKKLMLRNLVKRYPLYNEIRTRGRPKVLFTLVGEE